MRSDKNGWWSFGGMVCICFLVSAAGLVISFIMGMVWFPDNVFWDHMITTTGILCLIGFVAVVCLKPE